MKNRVLIWSLLYSILRISQGLLLHPYQTMQRLVREKVFIWLTFLPLGLFTLAVLFWRYLLWQFFHLLLPIWLSYWFLYFCFYWQLLLIYLLARFIIGYYHFHNLTTY